MYRKSSHDAHISSSRPSNDRYKMKMNNEFYAKIDSSLKRLFYKETTFIRDSLFAALK